MVACVLETSLLLKVLIFGIGKEYWELLVWFDVLPACVTTGWEYLYIMLFRSNLIKCL